MNQFATLEIHQKDRSFVISLNRPELHNAFDQRMIAELTEVFRTIDKRQGVRSVVLTGQGRTFCAGADLAMMKAAAEYDFEQNVAEGELIFDLMMAIDRCPLPVVGRINGSAIGGGAGIVSCCDIVIAVDRAKFSFSEARLGLVPAVISPFVIAKIGQTNARELFLTGERFDARHAQRIGLIHHVVKEETLDNTVAQRLTELNKAAPGAQTAAKEIIHKTTGLHNPVTGSELAEIIANHRNSAEGREGMNAFLDKRLPWWQENGE
jgi:methylglutaconyl-CoA hydratase